MIDLREASRGSTQNADTIHGSPRANDNHGQLRLKFLHRPHPPEKGLIDAAEVELKNEAAIALATTTTHRRSCRN